MKRNLLTKALETVTGWFTPGSETVPLNASAFPDSPADGITLDRLSAILSTAKDGNADELFALYADIVSRDADFFAAALQRKAPLVAKDFNLSTPRGSSAQLRENKAFLRAALARTSGKRRAIAHHLDASYWPVSIVRKVWAPAPIGSGRYYDLKKLEEVPFWRITFAADANGPAGVLKIRDLNSDGTLAHTTHLPCPSLYSIHRGHLLQALPDCWGGPMRAVVVWWYFGNWARTAAAQHLEACNLPKIVARYPNTDGDTAKRELRRALQHSVVTSAFVIPEDARLEALELLKADSLSAFLSFIDLCQRQISKVVAAQTMTLHSQAQGIGGTQANVQADALAGVQDFDAALLAETWQETIFRPLLELNARPAEVPLMTWGKDEEEGALQAGMVKDLADAGIRIRPDGLDRLSEFVGLPLEYAPAASAPGASLAGFSAAAPISPAARVHLQCQDASDALAEAVAGDFAVAFSAETAEIARALREARTPAELLAMTRLVVSGYEPHRSARIMEELLTAAAANGFACSHAASGQVSA